MGGSGPPARPARRPTSIGWTLDRLDGVFGRLRPHLAGLSPNRLAQEAAPPCHGPSRIVSGVREMVSVDRPESSQRCTRWCPSTVPNRLNGASVGSRCCTVLPGGGRWRETIRDHCRMLRVGRRRLRAGMGTRTTYSSSFPRRFAMTPSDSWDRPTVLGYSPPTGGAGAALPRRYGMASQLRRRTRDQ